MARPRGSPDRHGRALRTPYSARHARVLAARLVGAEVRRAREAQDVAASELAAACDCSADLIYRVERGANCATLGLLLRVARSLGVSVASLVAVLDD